MQDGGVAGIWHQTLVFPLFEDSESFKEQITTLYLLC